MALHTFFWKWKTHLSTIMVQWRSLFWYAHNSTSQKAIYCHSSPTLWMIACNSQRVEFISLSDINGLNWIYLFKQSELSFSDRWFCLKKKWYWQFPIRNWNQPIFSVIIIVTFLCLEMKFQMILMGNKKLVTFKKDSS